MISTVGVFKDAPSAWAVRDQLTRAGIPEDRQILLMPGASEEELARVPVTEGEQPGMGKVVGGLLGGAVGLGSAMSIGAAAGIVAIPGVGPVTVLGMLGLALLTLGGTAAGLKVGDMIDDRLDEGLPVDELYVYEDALRRGRSVVIALANEDEEAEQARAILTQAGAETVDAARDQWWIGLRSAEEEAYVADQATRDLSATNSDGIEEDVDPTERLGWNGEESAYRAGFESALLGVTHGRSYDEMKEFLGRRHPQLYLRPAFRRGYERGQEYDRARAVHRT